MAKYPGTSAASFGSLILYKLRPRFAQVIRKGLEDGPAAGYHAESEGFAELGMTSESKALKSIFFGQV